jgi:hypothetical protein
VYGHELLAGREVRKVTVTRHRDLRAHVIYKAVEAVDRVIELRGESS